MDGEKKTRNQPDDTKQIAMSFHYDVTSNSMWIGSEEDIRREKKARGVDFDSQPPLSDKEYREKLLKIMEEDEE